MHRLGVSFVFFLLCVSGYSSFAKTMHALRVDQEAATLEFEVDATMHGFKGRAAIRELTIEVEKGSPLPSTVRLVVAVREIATGNGTRDREMARWMSADAFPNIVFTLEEIVSQGSGYTASGHLEIAGVVRPVSFPLEIRRTGSRWMFTGKAVVDHREHGLRQIRRLGLLTVSPFVEVSFHVEADE
jgi:polyisoprenoid-binding protein YceI